MPGTPRNICSYLQPVTKLLFQFSLSSSLLPLPLLSPHFSPPPSFFFFLFPLFPPSPPPCREELPHTKSCSLSPFYTVMLLSTSKSIYTSQSTVCDSQCYNCSRVFDTQGNEKKNQHLNNNYSYYCIIWN